MLSRSARAVLDTALQKYRPGRTDLIPVGGVDQLKPALRLMTDYRLVIQRSRPPKYLPVTRDADAKVHSVTFLQKCLHASIL
jgi:hypothetical protein